MWRPAPHKIDPRAAAALRILLSLYIIGDIIGRLALGRIDLAWYHQEPFSSAYPAIVHPEDTPHGAPLHQVWFYRGSEQLQLCVFVLTTLLAVLFGLGWKCTLTGVLLWASVTAVQSRNPILNDGSDRYLRSILLWCMVLPIGSVWSIDARRRNKKEKHKADEPTASANVDLQSEHEVMSSSYIAGGSVSATGMRRRKKPESTNSNSEVVVDNSEMSNEASKTSPSPTYSPIVSAAALGLTLQIALMYWGTVGNRLPGTSWWYPKLDATYYAISSTFASRKWAGNFMQSFPSLSRPMTASAMVIETMGPLLCLLAPYDDASPTSRKKSWRHLPALVVASLHLGLYAFVRLPQWQFLGMICNIVFIPPHVWDALQDKLQQTKKPNEYNHAAVEKPNNKRDYWLSLVRSGFSWFFLLYMIYNFCGEQGLIQKHDNGDIGEAIQFSQYWKMYGPDAPGHCSATVISGQLGDATTGKRINILKALKTGDWGGSSEMDEGVYHFMAKEEYPEDMAARFPTWRWENAISKWAKEQRTGARIRRTKHTSTDRAKRLARFLCVVGNQERHKIGGNLTEITQVEIVWRGLRIMPMGSDERFRNYPAWDSAIEVACNDTRVSPELEQ